MRKCDRCGKELGEYGYMSQVNFPLVYVSYCVGLPIYSENADLCSKCQHDIYNYIFKRKEMQKYDDISDVVDNAQHTSSGLLEET